MTEKSKHTEALGKSLAVFAARRAGVSSKFSSELVLALAKRYAEASPDDFEAALRSLENALDTAAAERSKGRLPGNVSDAVEAVMARVDEMNDAGRIDEAEAELARLDAEHRDEIARLEQARLRIVDKRIAQAVLTRDVAAAVALELDKLALQDGGFEDLRKVWYGWYERGRDKGLRFDLEVAIGLAQAACDRAQGADQTGTALNDLGNALATLGERERDTARLQKAVAAFAAALEVWTRETVPLDWAKTQMNLGNALLRLGERDSGTARLEAAVAAFEAALEVWTRDTAPLDWAMTQNNLGTALQTLGERENDPARLDAAVAAYQAALEVRTRETVPLDWATTLNNLGSALAILGQRESGGARLEAAVAAYEAALEVQTRETAPLDWAATQMNLGNALRALGDRESGTARLEEAVTAYNAALEEWTRERVPLQWAMTQGNLCTVELTFFDTSGDPAHLDAAQRYLDAAREVFAEAGATQYLAQAERHQAAIDQRRRG